VHSVTVIVTFDCVIMAKVNVSLYTEVGYFIDTYNAKTSLQTLSLLNCVCQLYMPSVGQISVHTELSYLKILVRSTAEPRVHLC